MRKITHEIFGLLCGVAVYKFLGDTIGLNNEITTASAIGGCLLGAITPDIDHTQSSMGKKCFLVSGLLNLASTACGKKEKTAKSNFAKKLWERLKKTFGHRGIFHSPILWVLLTYLCFSSLVNFSGYEHYIMWFLTGLCFGAVTHIVADTLNPTGIAWLMPFSWHRISLAGITTGSGGEIVFRLVLIAIFFCPIVYTQITGIPLF